MRVSPTTVIAVLALFFALGGSAIAVTEAVTAPSAVPAGRGSRLHRRERRPREGHREPARSVHEREADDRRPLQLRRCRAAGSAGERRCLRGALPGERRPGRGGQRRERRDDDRAPSAAGVFRVSLWVPGRQDAIDTPFQVIAV